MLVVVGKKVSDVVELLVVVTKHDVTQPAGAPSFVTLNVGDIAVGGLNRAPIGPSVP